VVGASGLAQGGSMLAVLQDSAARVIQAHWRGYCMWKEVRVCGGVWV
jgi:hypothetical protein